MCVCVDACVRVCKATCTCVRGIVMMIMSSDVGREIVKMHVY